MKFSRCCSYCMDTCFYDEYIAMCQINLRVEWLHLIIRGYMVFCCSQSNLFHTA